MAGDQRATFQSFAEAGNLSWSCAGGVPASVVGLYYDEPTDKTYVGMPRRSGSFILIQ
jgi:hypothetical protein